MPQSLLKPTSAEEFLCCATLAPEGARMHKQYENAQDWENGGFLKSMAEDF